MMGLEEQRGSIQTWVRAAAGYPELSLCASQRPHLWACRLLWGGRAPSIYTLMSPEHSRDMTEIVGPFSAAQSIMFSVSTLPLLM